LNAFEEDFPELTTASELIEPLIYMTTSDERKKLYAAAEPKRALDRFWLDIANQDQALARQLIKIYYQRVKEANIFFSSHKAGWLTDRGMIFIIFGNPTLVNRRFDSEEWTYVSRTQGGPPIKYLFLKKPNNFTQNHYELVRSMSYEFLWYSTVEKWRKGIILEE
jgi:GWxTD domain-containing protein